MLLPLQLWCIAHLVCVFLTLQCSGELAAAVIGYLYTGRVKADASTAAEIISLANLWQLPGSNLAATHAIVFTLSTFKKNRSNV